MGVGGRAGNEKKRNGETEKRKNGEKQKSESKKESRKEKARLLQEKAQQLTPLKDWLKELEKGIKEMERQVERVHDELVAASTSGDGELIGTLSKKLSDVKVELENSYEELFETTEELERLEVQWEGKS